MLFVRHESCIAEFKNGFGYSKMHQKLSLGVC